MKLSRRLLGPAAVAVALLLAGCVGFPFGDGVPQPLPSPAGYAGSDGAILHLKAVDVGCCYIEGSLHFVQLEGPTSLTWQVNNRGTPGQPADAVVFEERPIPVRPGLYSVTFWQRPCSGSCDYLDPEVARCSASFEVGSGDVRAIEARFPLQGQCSVNVTSG